MTRSATTGYSRASWWPRALRTACTFRPQSTESGRAKYTYSNTHCSRWAGRNGLTDVRPCSSITRISPGSTSRSTLASIRSSAQVSEASTHASSSRPSVSGRKPEGSRTPMTDVGVSSSRV